MDRLAALLSRCRTSWDPVGHDVPVVDLRQLEYFAALSEEGSFVKAAAREHITQSALSQRIARLEREWGVVLFHRGVRGAELTKHGAELLDGAREVLAAVTALQARADAMARGVTAELRVGSATYGIRSRGRQQAVAEFAVRHPDVEVRFTNSWSPELLRMLLDGEVDLAFAMLAPPEERLEFMVVEDQPAQLLVPEQHRLATHGQVTLADLAGERVLLHPPSINTWMFEAMARALSEHGAIVAELGETSHPGIIEQVRAGLGLFPAVAWEMDFINPAELAGLAVVPTSGEEGLRYRLWLARRRAGRTAQIDAVWEAARQACGNA